MTSKLGLTVSRGKIFEAYQELIKQVDIETIREMNGCFLNVFAQEYESLIIYSMEVNAGDEGFMRSILGLEDGSELWTLDGT